jgi:Na+-translocating ferredoxin:NAD+ oxidoreductase RnfE subunit
MKKKPAIFLFALCPLVPAASRLSYGIVLSLAMLWILLWGFLFREIVRRMNAGKAGLYIEFTCLAGSATVFTALLRLFSPVLALSLGLYVFLAAFSGILLVSIDFFSVKGKPFLPALPFVPFLALFSCIREILGTGTVSFPTPDGMTEIPVIPAFETCGLGFWGTSCGALILLGIFAWIVKFSRRRIASYKRTV